MCHIDRYQCDGRMVKKERNFFSRNTYLQELRVLEQKSTNPHRNPSLNQKYMGEGDASIETAKSHRRPKSCSLDDQAGGVYCAAQITPSNCEEPQALSFKHSPRYEGSKVDAITICWTSPGFAYQLNL